MVIGNSGQYTKSRIRRNIQDNQRGVLLVNTFLYEIALKMQNENKNENMSQIQTAGIKERLAVENLLILN